MDKIIADIIDESIRVELNLSKLYAIFSKMFTQDSSFWKQLSIEEKDHASLLKSGKTIAEVANNFPIEILSDDIHKVIATNEKILGYINNSENINDRMEACKIAISFEASSSELKFQRFMNQTPENAISKIFVKLNYFDKDHAKRIHDYFKK